MTSLFLYVNNNNNNDNNNNNNDDDDNDDDDDVDDNSNNNNDFCGFRCFRACASMSWGMPCALDTSIDILTVILGCERTGFKSPVSSPTLGF